MRTLEVGVPVLFTPRGGFGLGQKSLQNLVLDIVRVAHEELHLVHSFFEPPRNQLIKN
jgi:hypothetical protein